MNQRKFNFKELMEHKPKTKIIVTEENEPNLDLMAESIFNLLGYVKKKEKKENE